MFGKIGSALKKTFGFVFKHGDEALAIKEILEMFGEKLGVWKTAERSDKRQEDRRLRVEKIRPKLILFLEQTRDQFAAERLLRFLRLQNNRSPLVGDIAEDFLCRQFKACDEDEREEHFSWLGRKSLRDLRALQSAATTDSLPTWFRAILDWAKHDGVLAFRSVWGQLDTLVRVQIFGTVLTLRKWFVTASTVALGSWVLAFVVEAFGWESGFAFFSIIAVIAATVALFIGGIVILFISGLLGGDFSTKQFGRIVFSVASIAIPIALIILLVSVFFPGGWPSWITPILFVAGFGLFVGMARKHTVGSRGFVWTASVTALLFVFGAATWQHPKVQEWTSTRFDTETGESNRQYVRSQDREGRVVEKRGPKAYFDKDSGQPLQDLTPEVFATLKFRFLPKSGAQNRKCFDDPATGEVREVFNTEWNYDPDTRAELRLCTADDGLALELQKEASASRRSSSMVSASSRSGGPPTPTTSEILPLSRENPSLEWEGMPGECSPVFTARRASWFELAQPTDTVLVHINGKAHQRLSPGDGFKKLRSTPRSFQVCIPDDLATSAPVATGVCASWGTGGKRSASCKAFAESLT